MQHSHLLRATACAACLLMGGGAFAQGAGGVQAAKKGGFTPVVMQGHGMGRSGDIHAFNSGRMNATVGVRGFNSAGNWQGRGWHGYGTGYGVWGAGYGYPYDYGYNYDDSGYAYDGYDNGYAYDNGPYVYAQGESGAYCQTPAGSCTLDRPSVAGAPCQCRSVVDQEPGTAQP